VLEKDIENLIAQYPDEFFPNSGFSLKGQQVKLGRCYADIVFKDKYSRTIIIEVKRGILSRDASGQIIEYYGLLKQEYPNEIIELILCANVIPHERKIFLENVGIECKELGFSLVTNLAKKYGYRFLDTKAETASNIQKDISIKTTDKQKVWIFQANPTRYDILNALLDSGHANDAWEVNQQKDKIKKGDISLIWASGSDGGIYAVADIVSDPIDLSFSPEQEKYWINEADKGKRRLCARISIAKNLVNNPVFRSELKGIKELSNLSILRFAQGTNFFVNDNEWAIIKNIINERSGV
jgi:hypothetical protein